MLTLLATALAAAFLSRRFTHRMEEGIAITMLDYQTIWQDAIALFGLIGSFCLSVIALGCRVRTYCDLALLPWLERRGIHVTIPAIDLPLMPQREPHALPDV